MMGRSTGFVLLLLLWGLAGSTEVRPSAANFRFRHHDSVLAQLGMHQDSEAAPHGRNRNRHSNGWAIRRGAGWCKPGASPCTSLLFADSERRGDVEGAIFRGDVRDERIFARP
jgi:hypothetical protein